MAVRVQNALRAAAKGKLCWAAEELLVIRHQGRAQVHELHKLRAEISPMGEHTGGGTLLGSLLTLSLGGGDGKKRQRQGVRELAASVLGRYEGLWEMWGGATSPH